jgi:hypothetical protein
MRRREQQGDPRGYAYALTCQMENVDVVWEAINAVYVAGIRDGKKELARALKEYLDDRS